MTIRTRIAAVPTALAAPFVAAVQGLHNVVLTEPNPVKRRLALAVSLVLFLPVIFIVGTFRTLWFSYWDILDNMDYEFGDLPHDIRDRWNGVGTR